MKKLLNEFNNLIYKCNISDKKNVMKTFNDICKIVENKKYGIEINIINNHINKILKLIEKKNNIICDKCNNDNKCNECIIINENLVFINFIEYKNKLLIKDIINLNSYNDLITNIMKNYSKKYNDIPKDKFVKLSIDKLLLENVNEFNGNWDIIICNSNGIPKKIEILDPFKINKIYEYINKYSNKCN